MHKNILQQLCHKKMWVSPAYTASRDGPDHDPRFNASVVVNGHTFDAPTLSKSVKEAQNKAAEVALDRLSSAVSSPAPSNPSPRSTSDVPISYKTQLQIYAQKRNVGVLKYDSIRAGPAHALRFKGRVTVDEQTFESPEYFNTLKDAEHSAARVALMSLPQEENHQEEPKIFKNLLQELIQKQGLSLPIYNTLYDGACLTPTFTSTVVVEGKSFVGETARTKKQAEMNAAKLAWDHFNEQGSAPRTPPIPSRPTAPSNQPPILVYRRRKDPSPRKDPICQGTNLHSMKVNHGKAIDNLEPNVLMQPLSLLTEESNQATGGNNVWLAKEMQYPCSISQKSYDDSPTSLRNQLTSVDRPNLNVNSIPSSSLKINQDFRPNLNPIPPSSLINKDHRPNVNSIASSSLKIKGDFRPNLNSFPSPTFKINEDFRPNPNSIPGSSLRVGEDFQTRGATTVMEQQILSIPPPDLKIKEGKQANDGKYHPNGVSGKNISYSELHSNGGAVMDPNAGPSNSKNKMPNANNPPGEIFSNGRADRLNYSSLKAESKEDGSSEDGDSSAIKDSDCDILKTGDSPTLLCNLVWVYPRTPDLVLPAGATLLPLSDSAWVAVNLDFPDSDDNP